MSVAQGGLGENLRAGGVPSAPSLPFAGRDCQVPVLLSWFFAVVTPVLLPVSPAVAFLKSIFMNACFNREN